MDIQLIAENVFRMCCDEDGNRASVESVVKFFKNKRDVEQWRLCNKEVDLLYDLLDPQSCQPSVDLSMLEIGLHKWVQYIRYRSSDEELPLDSVEDYSIFEHCTYAKLTEHADAAGEQAGDSGMPLADARLREFELSYVPAGDGDARPTEPDLSSYSDVADILSRLHQVRHENCVLVDEKKKLQAQLEAAEENLQQQQAQLAEWERKNRSLQAVARENKELRAEVEEVRGGAEALEKAGRQLQQAHAQTERELAHWRQRADDLSGLLLRRQQEVEQRGRSVEELRRSLREHKEAVEECQAVGRSQQMELEEKGLAVRQLNDLVEQLNEKSERLMRQTEEQDSQLHWYKAEVQKLRLSCSELDARKEREPRKCSTPHRLESLQSELYAGMGQDGVTDLPSPFCEKASSTGQLQHSRSFELGLGASRDSLLSVDELEPKTALEMEIDFLKLVNGVPVDAETKEKCIDVFRGVLNLHQRQHHRLVAELRQVKEQKSFVQSRYQEALQQLRDTSCLLETDIAEKMASLEEQIKAEQVNRLEMEAQLAQFRLDEEARLSKLDMSTQCWVETDLKSTQSSIADATVDRTVLEAAGGLSAGSRLQGGSEAKSGRASSVLLGALDLASPSTVAPKLPALLPDFDVEFSYSFDTPLTRRRDESSDTPSTSETRPESVRSYRPSRASEAASLPNDDAPHRSPTPTLSSCSSGARRADSSLKESDASEERDNASTTTTASSVEDLVVPAPIRPAQAGPMAAPTRRSLPGVAEERVAGPAGSEDDVFAEAERPPVFPSLPDERLKELELLSDSLDTLSGWSDEEAEQKFVHLSLAFRTDRDTLQERVRLHRVERDTSEHNAHAEVETVRRVVQSLSHIPGLSAEIVASLQHTCKVLEQSLHRLASKSELLGAVQQEARLSHAVDIMLHHMSSLRRSQARDSRELEEARRVLKASAPDLVGEGLTKRSLSLAGGGSPAKPVGKRPRTSGPDIFHFPEAAARSLPVSPSPVDQPMRRMSTASRKSTVSTDSHELRSRFQTGLYNSFQSPTPHQLRRLSTDRLEASLDLYGRFPSTDSTAAPHQANGRLGKLSNASDITVSSGLPERDAVFQKGLEQGLRAQVGHELGTLREEQASFAESLDFIMEVHSLAEEDLEGEEAYGRRDLVDFLITKGADFLSSWRYNISFLRARWMAGAAAFLMAVLILVWSVLWSVTVRHPTSAPS